jgi:hypothetical protein
VVEVVVENKTGDTKKKIREERGRQKKREGNGI